MLFDACGAFQATEMELIWLQVKRSFNHFSFWGPESRKCNKQEKKRCHHCCVALVVDIVHVVEKNWMSSFRQRHHHRHHRVCIFVRIEPICKFMRPWKCSISRLHVVRYPRKREREKQAENLRTLCIFLLARILHCILYSKVWDKKNNNTRTKVKYR